MLLVHNSVMRSLVGPVVEVDQSNGPTDMGQPGEHHTKNLQQWFDDNHKAFAELGTDLQARPHEAVEAECEERFED